MTTDTFEDELRSLLRNAADAEGPAYVDVDPGAVVSEGRRVVRRRRYAAGAAAAAAVLAIGITGAVIGGVGPNRADTTVPATQQATGPVTVDLTRTADVGDAWGRVTGRPQARVGVDLGRHTWTSARIADDGALSQASTGPLPANPLASTYKPDQGAPALVTGVLPASATAVAWIWSGEPQAYTQSLAPLPGTPYQAAAVWHADGAASQLVGLNWTDGTSVYSALGAKVPSITYTGAIGFVDPSQQTIGLYVDGQLGSSLIIGSDRDPVPTASVVAPPETATRLPVTVFAVLPAGATGIQVNAEGSEHQSETRDLGAAVGTGVLVRAAPAFDPGTTGVTITWTSADGSPGSLDADARR